MRSSQNWYKFLIYAGPFIACAGFVVYFVPEYRNLALIFLFTIISNSVIPMPYEPVMIIMGALFSPLLVAMVAACGNTIACFLDYEIIVGAFRHPKLQRVRKSDMYQGAVHYFLKAPLLCILIAAFAPFIPFYIFRVLSPTSDYPLKRYMAAVFLGRLPRYYIFAFMGSALLSARLLVICALLLLACVGLYLVVRHHLGARGRAIEESYETAETAD
jgi:membrane protein YqaA with SNARE-associated domain